MAMVVLFIEGYKLPVSPPRSRDIEALFFVTKCEPFEDWEKPFFCFDVKQFSSFPLSGFQGEATSAQLIGQAIASNPAFISLRRIEAGREIAHIIANSANKVYLGSDDLLLNLQKLQVDTVNK